MLSIIAFIVGALFGGIRARIKGGNMLDIAQYSITHGIAFALVALIGGVLYGRVFGF